MVGRKKLEGPGVNYFELPRRQLQSLCKKYGFPANRTNQLMAEFLTSHLNSDEYLNRDKSLPSPAVKTRFQCRDEEPATDDNLPTISESREAVAETAVRSLSQEFMNVDVTQNDTSLEAFKSEGTGLGEAIKNGSEDKAGGFPFEESKDFMTSGFRIREHESKSVQESPLSSTPEAESMDCETNVSSRGFPTGSGQLLGSEGIDVTTIDLGTRTSLESENPQGQETPLPLSIMPYVRPFTPESTLSHDGLKLFINLENDDGLPSVENMTNYYGAWGAQLPSRTNTTMQDDCILGSLKPLEGSGLGRPGLESHHENGSTGTDRAAEEGEIKEWLSQSSDAPNCSKETDPAQFKSCLVTLNRKAHPLSVSFLCPEPVFSSPRRINPSISDVAERSEIMKEWSATDESQETCERIDEISNSDEQTGELLLQKVAVELLVTEPSELNRRTPKSTADLESPSEGIVEKLVKICEERSPSTVRSASQRKESYKASPFLKSSRIAAELERASKVGQTRRGGILALKRAMGVAPLFSDTPGIQKEPCVSVSSTDGVVASDAVLDHSPVGSPGTNPIQGEGIQEKGVSNSDMNIETQTPRSAEEPPVVSRALRNEGHLQSAEDIVDEGEQIIGQMEIDCHKPEENEFQVAEEGVDFPATVEESVTDLSWMNKPIQLPTRRPASHKLKEKPGRPFSANGRKLELMERASSKLKMLKKNVAGIRPKTTLPTAGTEELEIQGRAEHVEPLCEVIMAKDAAEQEAANNSSPEEIPKVVETPSQYEKAAEGTSSQLETDDDVVDSSRQTEERISSIVERNTGKESSCEALIHNATKCIATDQELEGNPTEKPAAALNFLNIDFTKTVVRNVVEVSLPQTLLQIDCPNMRERITAERSTPLSSLDSNRRAMDSVADISQNPTTPTKPSSVLDFLSETVEKNGFSPYNKENEWSRRLEQFKTPLSGRSKEKALRTAEKKAATLREQLLRKRRGLIEGAIDCEGSLVQVIELSPIKKLATNRML